MAIATKTSESIAGKAALPQIDDSDPRIQRLVEEIESQVKESEISAVKVATFFAAGIASVFIAIGLLTMLGQLHVGGLKGPDWFIIGLMAFLGPTGFVRSREDKRIREIEERLPDFL